MAAVHNNYGLCFQRCLGRRRCGPSLRTATSSTAARICCTLSKIRSRRPPPITIWPRRRVSLTSFPNKPSYRPSTTPTERSRSSRCVLDRVLFLPNLQCETPIPSRLLLGFFWPLPLFSQVGTGHTVATLADASELPGVTVAQVNYATVTDGEVQPHVHYTDHDRHLFTADKLQRWTLMIYDVLISSQHNWIDGSNTGATISEHKRDNQ